MTTEAQTVRCPTPVARHVDTEELIYRVAAMLQYADAVEVKKRLQDEGVGRDTAFLVLNAAALLEEYIRAA
jgi:hypothetical protein